MRGFLQRHRRFVLAAAVFGVLLLGVAITGALAWRSLSRARAQLTLAHAALEQLVQNPSRFSSKAGRALAHRQLESIGRESANATQILSSSVALRVIGAVPGVSTQRLGAIELAQDVTSATRIGAGLLSSIDTLSASEHGKQISLAAMSSLGRQVAVSEPALRRLDRSDSGLWFSIATTRRSFDHEDQKLVATLGRYQEALNFALEFLGADGPRSYLLVAENNAEMRDQGSVLSYATVGARAGSLSVTSATTIHSLPLNNPVNVSIPSGTEKVFGGYEPTDVWQSVNATANFSWTGQDVAAMYHEATGKEVNGVIALDVPALASLLELTGPVIVAGLSQPVSAANANYVLLDQLYQGLSRSSSQTERRGTLTDVARAVVTMLATTHPDPTELVRTLASDANGRHLLFWDENAQVESELRNLGLDGDVDDTDPTRTFHLAVENLTATKLDYFVHVSENISISIDSRNDATAVTTVTLTNDAPKDSPASYQFGPDGINSFTPGEYIGGVYLWAPRGAVTSGAVAESGLTLTSQQLTVYPQQSATAYFTSQIQDAVVNGEFQLHLVPQPRADPIATTVEVADLSHRVQGAEVQSFDLTGTTALRWKVLPGIKSR